MDTINNEAKNTEFQFSSAPELVVNPSGAAPLAAQLIFETPVPVLAEITIASQGRSWTVPAPGEAATHHSHVLLGMRAGRRHEVALTLVEAGGGIHRDVWRARFETGPLPGDFPELKLTVADAGAMEPGFTFFGIRKSHRSGAAGYGVIAALDAEGEVVWLCDTGHTVGEIKRLQNGNLIYLTFDNRAIEIDMLGNRICQWFAANAYNAADYEVSATSIPVQAMAFHHDILELENGNFVVLGVEKRDFPDYRTSETDPDASRAPATVIGDVVTEFRRNGQIVATWSLLDILDPERLGYGSLADYWIRKGIPDSRDWSHTNSVVLDAAGDSFIISSRHQDAVVKFRRDTSEIVWILGSHDAWGAPWSDRLLSPQGSLDWQYHQHNATITSRGNILLFDNANHQALPFAEKQPPADSYSRAVEFAIDEDAMTVRQVWTYGDNEETRYYCPFICGAEELPLTDNVLVCFGGMMADEDGAVIDNPQLGFGWVRLAEVTRGTEARLVFELFIDERDQGKGWDVYRARRLPALYA
jgi:arylsulfate sulfotransferase